jgi:septal ring factor EnvC (AmiA/AmiB activator)
VIKCDVISVYCRSSIMIKLTKRWGDCKTRNETETKRNETSRNETKRNETQQQWNKIKTKQKRNETKRNETQQKRNETKQIINKLKNETNSNEAIFFYMSQQSAKCQWRIEKPLKFTGRFGYEKKNNQDFIWKSSPLSCFLCAM